jgi:hypothetical protein
VNRLSLYTILPGTSTSNLQHNNPNVNNQTTVLQMHHNKKEKVKEEISNSHLPKVHYSDGHSEYNSVAP